jgi:hypothetical protein
MMQKNACFFVHFRRKNELIQTFKLLAFGLCFLNSCKSREFSKSEQDLNTEGSPPLQKSQSFVQKVEDSLSVFLLQRAQATLTDGEAESNQTLTKDLCRDSIRHMNPQKVIEQPSLSNLGYYAFLAHLSYKKEDVVRNYLKDFRILNSTFVFDKTTSTSAYVWTKIDEIIVAFPGTNGVSDVLTDIDLNFAPTLFGASVHKGFLRAYAGQGKDFTGIRNQLQKVLVEEGYPTKKLTIVGHSLGGALAVLLASDLSIEARRGSKNAEGLTCKDLPNAADGINGIVTFGMPRVGDEDFARCYQDKLGARTLRVIYDRDFFPFVASDKYYRHAGRRIFLSKTGQLDVSDQPTEETKQGMLQFMKELAQGGILSNSMDHVSYGVKFAHFLEPKKCPNTHSFSKILGVK